MLMITSMNMVMATTMIMMIAMSMSTPIPVMCTVTSITILMSISAISAPGSGKTTLLAQSIGSVTQQLKTGVIVGDLATDNDAQRLRASGAPVVQITTGTMCHLEAGMVARAVKQLNLEGLELLMIE